MYIYAVKAESPLSTAFSDDTTRQGSDGGF